MSDTPPIVPGPDGVLHVQAVPKTDLTGLVRDGDPVRNGTKLTMLGEWHINVPGVGGPMEEMQARSHKAVVDGILANFKEKAEALVAA